MDEHNVVQLRSDQFEQMLELTLRLAFGYLTHLEEQREAMGIARDALEQEYLNLMGGNNGKG